MKLSDLIDRLIVIQNDIECYDVEVIVMEEHRVNGVDHQFSSKVTDIVSSINKKRQPTKVIIIGKEL